MLLPRMSVDLKIYEMKTISRTFTNNLPIPSTDENDGAEGYGAVGYAFGVESDGKDDGSIFGIP